LKRTEQSDLHRPRYEEKIFLFFGGQAMDKEKPPSGAKH